ncbi:uncharacterized protein TNIN_156781 [Trichonephila inaurata madagascariensis]|uniref:Uncharacterized protein n=1 Tax=Trichonephila inaurata madagascariensis TaxID=2747483 RepID=A0A8X6XHG9_9ARAC|nr:uncharacterized protein TNIN_156781 [Trichonephila inaurata madagascariensis]
MNHLVRILGNKPNLDQEIDYFLLFRYTGFCPDMAHRIGQNYTDTTREVIRERPHLRGRLGSIRRHEAQNAGVTYRSGEGFECHYDAMPEYAQGYTGHVPTNLWTSCKREDQTYEDPRCPLKAYPLSCSEYGSSCADKRCDDEYSFCSRQSHGFGDNASISQISCIMYLGYNACTSRYQTNCNAIHSAFNI